MVAHCIYFDSFLFKHTPRVYQLLSLLLLILVCGEHVVALPSWRIMERSSLAWRLPFDDPVAATQCSNLQDKNEYVGCDCVRSLFWLSSAEKAAKSHVLGVAPLPIAEVGELGVW